eukprot:scaffold124022_cov67-Phaeocystis_antarctica.AAC.7
MMPDAIIGGTNNLRPTASCSTPSKAMEPARPRPASAMSAFRAVSFGASGGAEGFRSATASGADRV